MDDVTGRFGPVTAGWWMVLGLMAAFGPDPAAAGGSGPEDPARVEAPAAPPVALGAALFEDPPLPGAARAGWPAPVSHDEDGHAVDVDPAARNHHHAPARRDRQRAPHGHEGGHHGHHEN